VEKAERVGIGRDRRGEGKFLQMRLERKKQRNIIVLQ